MSPSLSSPHDHFFRAALTSPKVAKEFFQATLPPALLAKTDLSTLTLVKDSFLDDTLRLQIADLLFEALIEGKKGYYILCEHQSSPDPLMAFRLLKYTLALQERHLKHYKTKVLPFVFPLVVYAGSKKYTASTDYFDLFGPHKELARQFWNPYALMDLTQKPDEAFEAYREFKVLALALKHIRDPDMIPLLREIMSLLQEIEKEGNIGYIECIVTYMQKAGEISSREVFEKTLLEGLRSVDEDTLMTWANYYRQEGRQRGLEEGMQQGMQQGMQTVALKMLQRNRPVAEILEDTGLSLKDLKKLQETLH